MTQRLNEIANDNIKERTYSGFRFELSVRAQQVRINKRGDEHYSYSPMVNKYLLGEKGISPNMKLL